MKTTHIIGGGTFSHVRNHLALAAPAFGATARTLFGMFNLARDEGERVYLHLTKMASSTSTLVTNDDVASLVDTLVADPATRVIIFNPALCDFDAEVVDFVGINALMRKGPKSGKHAQRLKSRETRKMHHPMGGAPLVVEKKPLLELTASPKILGRIRKTRKDIFLVSFKTTTGATEQEQYVAGLNLLKETGSNLVLANDTVTRLNMVIVPEENRYHVTTDRQEALQGLVEMTTARTSLTFTRSTVVGTEDDLVPWDDERIPANLRAVVDHCIDRGAYKTFRGSTAGHFAVKLGPTDLLTSCRKTNYNVDLHAHGLVWVELEEDDKVTAHGARPSVGAQSQKAIYEKYPGADCIVHAHVPLRPDAPDAINVRSQREFECGSHQCGKNTADGLTEHVVGSGRILAVMLDAHGPNIVFSRDTPAEEVIAFIERNFDLSQKTGGTVDLGVSMAGA